MYMHTQTILEEFLGVPYLNGMSNCGRLNVVYVFNFFWAMRRDFANAIPRLQPISDALLLNFEQWSDKGCAMVTEHEQWLIMFLSFVQACCQGGGHLLLQKCVFVFVFFVLKGGMRGPFLSPKGPLFGVPHPKKIPSYGLDPC